MTACNPLGLYQETGNGKISAPDKYKGIPIHAMKGLHDFIFQMLRQHYGFSRLHIADLGAGGGAMSQRFIDQGSYVTSFDAVDINFRATNKQSFHCTDLNYQFSDEFNEKFDLISAIEIIEHLENPRNFLRNCYAMLKPGGKIILSTPNVNSNFSLTETIIKNSFTQFDDAYYQHGGHITPMATKQLEHIFSELELSVQVKTGFGEKTISFREWPRFYATLQIVKWLRSRSDDCKHAVSIYLLEK